MFWRNVRNGGSYWVDGMREEKHEIVSDPDPVTIEIRIGVDLGSNTEPTGITVIECEVRDASYLATYYVTPSYDWFGRRCQTNNSKKEDYSLWLRRGTHYSVIRHLERIPAGTKYPDIIKRVRELYDKVSEQTDSYKDNAHIYIECAGQLPVGMQFQDAIGKRNVTVVQLTSGDNWEHDEKAGIMTLSKNALVSKLNMILQYSALELPAESNYTAGIVTDIENYTPTNDLVGAVTFGDSAKTGPSNDFVVSLGVACFPEPFIGIMSGTEFDD